MGIKDQTFQNRAALRNFHLLGLCLASQHAVHLENKITELDASLAVILHAWRCVYGKLDFDGTVVQGTLQKTIIHKSNKTVM